MSIWEKIKNIFSKKGTDEKKLLPEAVYDSTRETKKSYRESMKYNKEELLSPKNLARGNWRAIMLKYLGVKPSLADNPIAINHIQFDLNDLIGREIAYEFDKGNFSTENIKNAISRLSTTEIINGDIIFCYEDSITIRREFDSGSSYSEKKVFINGKNGISTKNIEHELGKDTQEDLTYNEKGILMKKEIESYDVSKIQAPMLVTTLERDENNPFIATFSQYDRKKAGLDYKTITSVFKNIHSCINLDDPYFHLGFNQKMPDETMEQYEERSKEECQELLSEIKERIVKWSPDTTVDERRFLKYYEEQQESRE